MATTALVWDLIARDRASGAFAKAGTSAEANSIKMSKVAKALGAFAAVDIGYHMVKSAGEFQQSTNVLVTAAGESTKNLKLIRQGILNISSGTGTAWKEVTDGIYGVEKAGYRGADALKIMKAAAQGAREEGANLATVAGAMTSVMASYHLKASDAVMVMNEMKTAAGEAKTTMEQFSGSLSTVLPIASANKISFADIAGSLASMTQHGTSADEAAQELANTMRGLSAPNMVAIKEMSLMGIKSTDVATKLGDGPGGRGLAGTLNYLAETVLTKMGPSGLILLRTFNNSKVAAEGAAAEFKALPKAAQDIATAYKNGSLSLKDYRNDLKGLPAPVAALLQQWKTSQDRAKGFTQAIRNGSSQSQTFMDAIKKMAGGANGLNTLLQLTGGSMDGTNTRIGKIAASAKHAGRDVQGWNSTQKLFNVQLDMFKQKVEAAGIRIGTAMLPAVTSIVKHMSGFADMLQRNGTAVRDVAIGVGLFTAALLLGSIAAKAYAIAEGIMAVVSGEVAAKTGLQTIALVLSKVAMVAATVASKAFAVGMWLVNAALDGNPIGAIILVLIGLGIALIVAYRHSETFRNIVKGAFDTVKRAVSDYYHYTVMVFKVIAAIWKGSIVAVRWLAYGILSFFVKPALNYFGLFLQGAADAFGWVPGIGGKLKTAAAKFKTFKDDVNNALNKIKPPRPVKPTLNKKALQKIIDALNNVAGMQIEPTVTPRSGGSFGKKAQVHAQGTGFAPGGLSTLSERGIPELVLPRGASVMSGTQTASLLRGGGGGSTTVVDLRGSSFMGSEAEMSRQLVSLLEGHVGRGGKIKVKRGLN